MFEIKKLKYFALQYLCEAVHFCQCCCDIMTEITINVPDEVAKKMEKMRFINWNELLVRDILFRLSERDIVEAILAESKMTEEDAEELDRIVKRGLFEKHYRKAQANS
ncbi:MAG: hypothetical protein OIN88_09585 [Candidatus Methanoperedens sp.]|nr:hypothetical protein [Candidatus Methanoperedens sp.]MCZ7359152.1 hypothetical protein [Candidatus Methanoperedens sp.]HLB72041.1 hypothetical protein [Candidatus Methanoperedens sp.]